MQSSTRELVASWLAPRVVETRTSPLVVGVNGPQGSGKSTLTAQLTAQLEAQGVRAATVSIDDFYLTREEQQALADTHPDEPHLQVRGYPGTHDVALGERVLRALCASEKGVVSVPVYDKGAHGGLGARADRALWRAVQTPLDVLFFEGWMLGFCPVFSSQLLLPSLATPNALLASYEGWHALLDAFVHLDAREDSYVVAWRVEAEARRRAVEGRGLSDDEARAYVLGFLPAYAQWVPGLRARPPGKGAALRVVLEESRRPIERYERGNTRNGAITSA